jgi:hypothetical protein
MATKRYRDEIEDIAERILRLRYADMMTLAKVLDGFEIDGSETPTDWAGMLHDWAQSIEDNYQSEDQA